MRHLKFQIRERQREREREGGGGGRHKERERGGVVAWGKLRRVLCNNTVYLAFGADHSAVNTHGQLVWKVLGTI